MERKIYFFKLTVLFLSGKQKMEGLQMTIGIVDYVIFGLFLLASSVIGIYFGYKHRKQMTSAEYLLASRSVSWIPICISLVVSFFSSVGIMGITANIYMTGVTFALHVFSFLVPIVLNAEVFAPIFRKLELVSVNNYLEMRFSKPIQLLGCFFFFLQYIVFLAIVLYAPSLALETVAGVPLIVSIITTGLVCTFYTSLGGMRAVIWTDVFQTAIMFIGLAGSAIIGVIKIGSFEKIYNVTTEFKRLHIDLNPDPRGYQTLWGTIIGVPFSIMASWTITQPTVQRVIAAKSLKDAKKALYASFFGLLIIFILLTVLGLVIFTTYAECDLLMSKRIKTPDQVLPFFIVDKFGDLPGVTGIFMACLFSFTISTLSSALNSLAAVFLEDIVKTFNPIVTETVQTRTLKIVACVCGFVVIGLAFVVPYIGNAIIKVVIQLFGIVGGPYFGLFVLGIFFRRSNSIGAAVGSLSGLLIGIALMVGQMIYPPPKGLPPVSMMNCSSNITVSQRFIYPKDPVYQSLVAELVNFSYLWFGLITVFVTIIVGYLVSLCCCFKGEPYIDDNLFFHWRNFCTCCQCCRREKTTYDISDQEIQEMMMQNIDENNYGSNLALQTTRNDEM